MKINFSPPDIREEDIQAVAEALRSGWITTGPKTKQFEKELSAYIGVDKVCCLNSQTACSEQALRALGIGPGDEVITTAYTYTASASVIRHVGATVILLDIQKDSYEMDYDLLAESINEKTKVIIPVDLAGIPCDYERIFEIVESKKQLFTPKNELQAAYGRVIVLADTAHSLGARRGEKNAGAMADFSSFSFHAVKNLTTAEGGALSWRNQPGIDNEEMYRKLQLLSLHGQSKDALQKTQLGSWEYDVIAPYYKCNMTDIQAALGISQLVRYEEMLERRREIVKKYDDAFVPHGIEVLNHLNANHRSSTHLYFTNTPWLDSDGRNTVIRKMAEAGIACNVHYKPLPLLTAYKQLGYKIEDYPNAYQHFKNQITLPLHTLLTDEEVDYIIEHFLKYTGN